MGSCRASKVIKMKRYLLLVTLLSPAFVSAQDVLITKDGDALKVWGIEMSNSSVFYRESEAEDNPIKRIEKKDVLMIKYKDGRKVIMNDDQQATTVDMSQPTATTSVPSSPGDFSSDTLVKDNLDFVRKYNSVEVDFKENLKDKDGKILYCQLGIKESSIMYNNDVRMTLRTGDYYSFLKNVPNSFDQKGLTTNTGMEVIIQNLRTQTIYIDLGNSFFIRNDEASPYYIPSATSSTVTSGTGTSVNMGAVANALGVDGPVGKLANGVNMGQSSTHGTTNIVYSQRIIAIPPRSTKTLEYQLFFPAGSSYGPFTTSQHYKNDYDVITRQKFKLKWGEKHKWTEDDSPLTFGVFVAYSFDENCQQTKNIHADLFLKMVMGAGYNMGQPFVLRHEYLTDNWNSVLYFAAKNY